MPKSNALYNPILLTSRMHLSFYQEKNLCFEIYASKHLNIHVYAFDEMPPFHSGPNCFKSFTKKDERLFIIFHLKENIFDF